MKSPYPILAYSDLHFPFSHPKALPFLRKINKRYKPRTVVFCGDLVDNHALSRFTTEPDAISAMDELAATKKLIAKLYKLFPKMIITIGNHTSIPVRLAKEVGMSKIFMKSVNELIDVPKEDWKFVTSIDIDGIHFKHKLNSAPSSAINTAIKLRKPLVGAHTHSFGGVVYSSNGTDTIFGANCGALVDESKYAFAYGKECLNKATLGCILIHNQLRAEFIPLY